jgi:hypothetical protein
VRDNAAQWVLHKPLSTFVAQIEAGVMVYVIFERRFVYIVKRFQDVLNLLQVIAIVAVILVHRIERRIYLQPHDVTGLVLRVEGTFAAIACVVDHSLGSFVSFDLY